MSVLKIRNAENTGWIIVSFTGAQGVTGAQGPRGNQGYQGVGGNQGYQGVVGNQGYQGTQGSAGQQGVQGATGEVGSDGLNWLGAWDSETEYDPSNAVENDGTSYICSQIHTNEEPPNATYWSILSLQGAQGPAGNQGSPGNQGNQGEDGVQGATGVAGNQGATGATGQQGVLGNQGNQGEDGVQGATGAAGNQGPTGQQGVAGNQGNQGETGVQGSPGNQGVQGTAGQQGVAGQQGATGVLGDALASAVLIDTGGYFLIGSGTKDVDLTGIWIDNTEIVQQVSGSDVFKINASGVFTLTASQAGAIVLNAGADITLISNISNPALIKFQGSSCTTMLGNWSAGGTVLKLVPSVTGQVDFEIGNEVTSKLFEEVKILATDKVWLKSKYDPTGYGEIFIYSGSTETNVRLNAFSPNGSYFTSIAVEARNAYGHITMSAVEIIMNAVKVYPQTDSATTLGKTDRYWSILFADAHYVDSTFYLWVSGLSNPLINFAANDYLFYDRSQNNYNFVVGGTLGFYIALDYAWCKGNFSCLTFTDRSKEFVGSDALSLLKEIKPDMKTIKGNWAEVDHTTLPEGVRKTIKGREDEEDEEGRDIGAMISLVNKAVLELDQRLEALEV